MVETFSTLPNDFILGDRYRVIKQIGQGGFGRTYLAEDIHRYNERCVLKEFAPLVENDRELQKAEELFERESGILYKLEHDRIPRFKALLRTRIESKRSLFLVQEYVAGETYYDLLKDEGKFSESEVIEMIIELLPVLEYIHQKNLIHRDISPDNLIYRRRDKKPVLIDFGCVKLAANAVSRSRGHLITVIGKKGYAPEEQIRDGSAFPCSDLYSLAATAVVLLTGKSPEQLYDTNQGKWQWEKEVTVSPQLTKVLNKMLAYRPSDRYQSATEIIQVFDNSNSSFLNACISRIKTLVVAPKNSKIDYREEEREPRLNSPQTQIYERSANSNLSTNISRIKTQAISVSRNLSQSVSTQINRIPYVRKIRPWQWGAIVLAVATLPGLLTFVSTQKALLLNFNRPTSSLTEKEQSRQQKIHQRVLALNLNTGKFYEAVDREFYNRYPQFKNVSLTDSIEHRSYREAWYRIAEKMLQKRK